MLNDLFRDLFIFVADKPSKPGAAANAITLTLAAKELSSQIVAIMSVPHIAMTAHENAIETIARKIALVAPK